MVSKDEEITISVVLSRHEYAEAIQFIENEMRKNFGCDPPATTVLLFLVRAQGKIVGSISLQGRDGNGFFPIENHYQYQLEDSVLPFDRNLTVQATRWIATQERVSMEILQASFSLAYTLGKRHMLIEAKPYATRRLGELGIICKEVKDIRLHSPKIRDEVGENGMKYFLESPVPTLYVIDIQESLMAFGSV